MYKQGDKVYIVYDIYEPRNNGLIATVLYQDGNKIRVEGRDVFCHNIDFGKGERRIYFFDEDDTIIHLTNLHKILYGVS